MLTHPRRFLVIISNSEKPSSESYRTRYILWKLDWMLLLPLTYPRTPLKILSKALSSVCRKEQGIRTNNVKWLFTCMWCILPNIGKTNKYLGQIIHGPLTIVCKQLGFQYIIGIYLEFGWAIRQICCRAEFILYYIKYKINFLVAMKKRSIWNG